MEFVPVILPVEDSLLKNHRNHDIPYYSRAENETLLVLFFQIVSDLKW